MITWVLKQRVNVVLKISVTKPLVVVLILYYHLVKNGELFIVPKIV